MTTQQYSDITETMRNFLDSEGYYMLRLIDGKICGLHNYMTTTGLCIGLNEQGLGRRYCFQNPAEAVIVMTELTTTAEHVSGNWIKVKGTFNGQFIDAFNSKWTDADGTVSEWPNTSSV